MNLKQTVIALGFFDGVHRGHGALLKKTAERAQALGADLSALTWGNYFVGNMLPVTLGNILGGLFVGFTMWFGFLRKAK